MMIGNSVQIIDLKSICFLKYGKIVQHDTGVMFLVQLNIGYTTWFHKSSLKVVPESEFDSSIVLES